jgi:DNA (cytosine-5)-methyltransferase 1
MLFEYILNIAMEKRPSFLFLENVKHIKKIDGGRVFHFILERINASGYLISEESVFELSPHQLGVPQQRERVLFVCVRNDIPSRTVTIVPPNPKIDTQSIFEATPDPKYNLSNEVEHVLEAWDEMVQHVAVGETLSPTILCNEFHKTYTPEEFAALAKWKQDYIKRNRPLYMKYQPAWDAWYEKHAAILSKREVYGKLEWQTGKTKASDSIFNHFIQLRQSGIRVKKTNYFPTLVAIVQTPIYAKERRYITPRECARLQSFPDSFVLHEKDQVAYKQLGNAVNVKVVHFVMQATLEAYKL